MRNEEDNEKSKNDWKMGMEYRGGNDEHGWLLAPGRRDHSSSKIQEKGTIMEAERIQNPGRREGDWQKWFSGLRSKE